MNSDPLQSLTPETEKWCQTTMLEAGFSLPVKESGLVEETGEPLHKHAYLFVQTPSNL